MNKYEEKQAARKERLEARAEKANEQAIEKYTVAKNMGDSIPFGQPILVGHHSEKRDRRFRSRITKNMDKSVEFQKKAAELEYKASRVGKGGISSDDPSAIEKLEKKLATLIENQDLMKKANAVIRKHKDDKEAQISALLNLSDRFTLASLEHILTPQYGKQGFAAYALSNNNAKIHSVKKRIETLKATREHKPVLEENDLFIYKEDSEENRVMFIFDGKPSNEIRSTLKANAFKWSPSRNAWVRQLTNAGIAAARIVKEKLQDL